MSTFKKGEIVEVDDFGWVEATYLKPDDAWKGWHVAWNI